jgi:hypothetical protein
MVAFGKTDIRSRGSAVELTLGSIRKAGNRPLTKDFFQPRQSSSIAKQHHSLMDSVSRRSTNWSSGAARP